MEVSGMTRGSPVLLLLLSFLFIIQTQSSCLPKPVGLRIGNVTLENYNSNSIRGIDISVGGSQQAFAFTPQMPLNESFVWWKGNGFCSTDFSTNACATFRGGLYDNTSTSLDPAFSNSHTSLGTSYPPCQFVTDKMTLNANTSLSNFSFGIAQKDVDAQGYHPQAGLGLGRNSTLLNYMKKKNLIASRTWGYFWGLNGGTDDSQMDGSLVLGGYDSAKVSGANYTQSLQFTNKACSTGMFLVLTDITLNFRNGTTQSLFGGVSSAAVNTCLDPDYPALMSIPYDPYFANFEGYTNASISARSFGINYYVMRYSNGQTPFDGDITISLNNGLSVRIPNNQLVVPDSPIDETSGAVTYNYTDPDLLLLSLQDTNKDDMTVLGRNFFTSAYLMVNHDASQYTLWAANATREKALVAVDGNNQVYKDLCTVDTASPLNPSTTTTTTSSKPQNGLSSAGIAGVVVGSVAGVALVLGALLFFLRKKKAKTQPVGAGGYGPNAPSGSISTHVDSQELPAEVHPHELLGTLTQNELAAKENPVRPRVELE